MLSEPIASVMNTVESMKLDVCADAADRIYEEASQKVELAKTSKTKVRVLQMSSGTFHHNIERIV